MRFHTTNQRKPNMKAIRTVLITLATILVVAMVIFEVADATVPPTDSIPETTVAETTTTVVDTTTRPTIGGIGGPADVGTTVFPMPRIVPDDTTPGVLIVETTIATAPPTTVAMRLPDTGAGSQVLLGVSLGLLWVGALTMWALRR